MQGFEYINGQLNAEGVALSDIADKFGTPCYVYSRAAIEERWQLYETALADRKHAICYSVKANGNLAVLNVLAQLGSGFDIVSVGELQRVIAAGGDPGKVIFSGVGKQREEMRAALDMGIRCFNVESRSELLLLNTVAGEASTVAPVSLRVNPDVDAKTHPYISTGLKQNKFGIAIDDAETIYQEATGLANINIVGVDCHIGSQITEIAPYLDAIQRVIKLVGKLEKNGIPIKHIDIGGGLGICYKDEIPPSPAEFIHAISAEIDHKYELMLEPGRSIVGNAGVLLTTVLYLKQGQEKNFAIVDGAMNDLIRPALYDAWQEILPAQEACNTETRNYDIVGPVCETADFLGLDRELALAEGDLLAVCGSGAYGFVMSSNYNARPRACEVMVDSGKMYEIRKREKMESLYEDETLLPETE